MEAEGLHQGREERERLLEKEEEEEKENEGEGRSRNHQNSAKSSLGPWPTHKESIGGFPLRPSRHPEAWVCEGVA